LQRKATTEISAWVKDNVADSALAQLFLQLPRLAGGREVLSEARTLFADCPVAVLEAVNQLEAVADAVEQRYPGAELYFDLSELRGYHYLTGLVFAAFAPGYGNPVASGGRYDHIGEVFGRARPATGFGVDITTLSKLGILAAPPVAPIFAPVTQDPAQWQAIRDLRGQGERVICAAPDSRPEDLGCDRQLVSAEQGYVVVPIE